MGRCRFNIPELSEPDVWRMSEAEFQLQRLESGQGRPTPKMPEIIFWWGWSASGSPAGSSHDVSQYTPLRFPSVHVRHYSLKRF